jgi:DNA-binding GntR family transcriptional regulator
MYQKDNGPDFIENEHGPLLDAISAREEDLAVQLMDDHLVRLEKLLTFDRKIPSNDISMALA